MVAGRPVDVECKSTGSRPEAVITWWLGTRQIQRLAKHVSLLGGLFQEAQLAHKQSIRSLCPSSFFLSARLPLQFSETGNQSLSVLTFTPTPEEDGKYLTCRAENPFMADSGIEDKWRLVVHCE